jgi:hypothetical protein
MGGSISMSWESVYKISLSWFDVLIFYALLFGVVSVWPDAMDRTKEQHRILCRSQKPVKEDVNVFFISSCSRSRADSREEKPQFNLYRTPRIKKCGAVTLLPYVSRHNKVELSL